MSLEKDGTPRFDEEDGYQQAVETREEVEEGEDGSRLTTRKTTITRVTATGVEGDEKTSSTTNTVTNTSSSSSRRSHNSSTTSTGSGPASTDEVGGAGTKKNFAARMAKFENTGTEAHKSQGRKPLVRAGSSSSTNRLGGSRFAKFEKGADSTDSSRRGGAAPLHARKLDNTKFSKFGKEAAASTDPAPAPAPSRGFRMAAVATEKCAVCDKRVYPMEKCSPDGTVYHKKCFKCAECKKLLKPEDYASVGGRTYCKPHYTQLFRLKGSYDLAAASSRTPPKPIAKPANNYSVAAPEDSSDSSSIVSHESPKKYIAEDEIPSVEAIRSARSKFAGGGGQDSDDGPPTKSSYPSDFPLDRAANSGVSENQPEVRQDVVHAADKVPETFSLSTGGLRSLRDTFEKGNVSNVQSQQQRAERAEAQPRRSIEDYGSPEAGGGGAGQVSENQPEVRRDLVRESSQAEEPEQIFSGLGQLRASFEQGAVSNVEVKRSQLPEDLLRPGSIEDFGGSGGQPESVAENQPEERPDLVRETTPRAEAMSLGGGGLKSIKDMFETGQVRQAPVPASRRPPKDFPVASQDLDAGQVSESTPAVNSQAVRSTVEREVPVAVRGTAHSLKNRWEKGEVHNAESKKPVLERQPHSFVKAEPPLEEPEPEQEEQEEEEEERPEPEDEGQEDPSSQQPQPRPRSQQPQPRPRSQLPSLPSESGSELEEHQSGGRVNGNSALPATAGQEEEEEEDLLHISEPASPLYQNLPGGVGLANGGGKPGSVQPNIDDLVDDFGYERPLNMALPGQQDTYDDLLEEGQGGDEQYYEQVGFSEQPPAQALVEPESFDN